MKKFIVALLLSSLWLQSNAADLTWSTNFPAALTQAKAENKLVLLNFTGSDWCVWCMHFDRVTLNTEKFTSYAQTNLELVLVDFPNKKPQSDALKIANKALSKKYKVKVFPTFVVLDANGKELGRQTGYSFGGASTFIRKINAFKNSAPSFAQK